MKLSIFIPLALLFASAMSAAVPERSPAGVTDVLQAREITGPEVQNGVINRDLAIELRDLEKRWPVSCVSTPPTIMLLSQRPQLIYK